MHPSAFRHLRVTELADAVALHRHERWVDRTLMAGGLGMKDALKKLGESPLSEKRLQPVDNAAILEALRYKG